MPGSKGLSPHELAHRWVKDLRTRPDMSIKDGPNPSMHAHWFGLFRFRSPLLTESHVVFSSSGYLDVSVHRVPFLTLWIGVRIPEVCSGRFPHSEISGSMGICPSPKLFAAYHVFHRLLVPRHPPYALISITNSTSSHGNGIMSTHA